MVKKLSAVFMIIIISLSQIPITLSAVEQIEKNLQFNNGCPGPFPSEGAIEMTTFPIDLDYLFCQDNETLLNFVLNNVSKGSIIWPITPWNSHFHSGHIEGSDKWYLQGFRRMPVRAPHDGTFGICNLGGDTISTYNTIEFKDDINLAINIGNGFSVGFAHLSLLKSIYDKIMITGNYTFLEGELLGYTADQDWHSGIDFSFLYRGHAICPLKFFSDNLQTKITNYYEIIYEQAIIAGSFPQSNICNNHTCEIENQIWGVWNYTSGPYDEDFANPDYNDPHGFWTFFNRDYSNPETFYRVNYFPHNNFSEDVIGILAEAFPVEITDYKNVYGGLLTLTEGNYSSGIMKINLDYASDWGTYNDTIYTRYSITPNGEGARDDILTLEFFADLISAQAGFTDDKITANRYYHYPFELPTSTYTGLSDLEIYLIIGTIGIIVLTVIILIPILIVRKRKKKNREENY